MSNYKTFTQQRNEAFFRTCTQIAREAAPRTLTDRRIVELALKRPTDYFYVSLDATIRRLRRMRAGGAPTVAARADREMLLLLDRLTAGYEFRFGLTDLHALQRVHTDCGAPCYYICPATAVKIFRRYRKAAAMKNPKTTN